MTERTTRSGGRRSSLEPVEYLKLIIALAIPTLPVTWYVVRTLENHEVRIKHVEETQYTAEDASAVNESQARMDGRIAGLELAITEIKESLGRIETALINGN